MAAYNKFNAYVADVSNKVHNLASDSFQIALTNVAPVATNAVLTDLTEIAYTNLSARALTVASSTQTGGTQKWVINDLTLTASGAVATFRYVVIYNNTAASKNLVSYYDYGAAVTMASGETFIVDFDGTNGVSQLS